MIFVAGLGNPGQEYKNTRHNVGKMILENISKDNGFSDWKEDGKSKSLRSKGEINKESFDFILPNNFMNNSGFSVASIINNLQKLKKTVVIYDDIDLPFGVLKISFNRSSGGHNGLESIIKKLKSKEFLRVRIGVSPVTPSGKIKKPKGEDKVVKFLLGNFKEDELKEVKKMSKKVSQILVSFSCDGKEKTMSIFN